VNPGHDATKDDDPAHVAIRISPIEYDGEASPSFHGNTMAAATFEQLKSELDAACESLRGFTLGRDGFTLKDGRNAMKLVADLCER
jgi:hypothetical protein